MSEETKDSEYYTTDEDNYNKPLHDARQYFSKELVEAWKVWRVYRMNHYDSSTLDSLSCILTLSQPGIKDTEELNNDFEVLMAWYKIYQHEKDEATYNSFKKKQRDFEQKLIRETKHMLLPFTDTSEDEELEFNRDLKR